MNKEPDQVTDLFDDCKDLKSLPAVSRFKWTIERLFGSNHWCVPWVNELCNSDIRFFIHLTQQQQPYIHFLCLVRLAMLARGEKDDDYQQQADWIRTHDKKTVLHELYEPVPEGLLSIFYKLGPYALSQHNYKLMLQLLSDKRGHKYLAHKKRISQRDLQLVPVLIEASSNNLSIGKIRNIKDIERIEYYTKVTQIIAPHLPLEQIIQSLMSFRRQEQFAKWIDKKLSKLHFADPPWPGNNWIHPLTTAADLKSAARQFENCCYDYLTKIIFGRCYFYTLDKGPALVLIVRDALLGWELDEVKGTANKTIRSNLKSKILDAFRQAGIHQRGRYRWHDELDDFLI